MKKLFYEPDGYKLADTMLFHKDGTFYLYHYQFKPEDKDLDWWLSTTKDFVHYENHGPSLLCGPEGADDHSLRSGSLIEKDGTFYFFFGGGIVDAEGSYREKLLRSRGTDLLHWERDDWEMTPPAGYDPAAFRDEYVYWNEELGKYLMVVGACKPVNGRPGFYLNGCTLLFSSDDLDHWSFEKELWAPELYTMHEMPDLFRIGEWWYLITFEYSDQIRCVYRMSRSLDGPWLCPPEDGLDGKAYIAARTIEAEGKRYLIGIAASKDGNDVSDYANNGSMLVHEVTQRPDGTLFLSPVPGLREAFLCEIPLADTEISAPDGRTEKVMFTDLPDSFLLDADVTPESSGVSFAVGFYENTENGQAYQYKVSLPRENIVFEKSPSQGIHPGMRWPVQMERLEQHIRLTEGKTVHMTLAVSASVSVLYLDGVPLTCRYKEPAGNGLYFAVSDGQAAFGNVVLRTELR